MQQVWEQISVQKYNGMRDSIITENILRWIISTTSGFQFDQE